MPEQKIKPSKAELAKIEFDAYVEKIHQEYPSMSWGEIYYYADVKYPNQDINLS